MSLSWLDRVRVPVTLRVSARAVSIHCGGQHRDACVDSEDQETPWHAALQAAEQHLAALDLARWRRRVRVVVGNDLARYVVLPWTEQWLDEGERLQYVRMLFEERYGIGHDACVIAVEAPRFGMPALAAAIDSRLVDDMKAMLMRCKLRFCALLPALAEHFNDIPTKTASAGWLADSNDGQLVTLAFANGKWLRVSGRRHVEASSLRDALLEVLRRDAIAYPALLDGKVWLKGAPAFGRVAEWNVVPVAVKT